MKLNFSRLAIAFFSAIAIVVSIANGSTAHTILGTSQPIGEGSVRAYITLDATGKPEDLGVIVAETALTNLPSDRQEYLLPLPDQATLTAFDHIGVNWSPSGHDPQPIYGSPHFDVHFYTISPEARQAITATDDNLEVVYRQPDAALIPTGYVMAPGSAEPTQGAHWIDPAAAEFQGMPHGFDFTFVYGFYNGDVVFEEPMISLNMLTSHQTRSAPISQPERFTKSGYYPTRYSLTYDATHHDYRLSLVDWVNHSSVS